MFQEPVKLVLFKAIDLFYQNFFSSGPKLDSTSTVFAWSTCIITFSCPYGLAQIDVLVKNYAETDKSERKAKGEIGNMNNSCALYQCSSQSPQLLSLWWVSTWYPRMLAQCGIHVIMIHSPHVSQDQHKIKMILVHLRNYILHWDRPEI